MVRAVPRWAFAALLISLTINLVGVALVAREASQHGGISWITDKLGVTSPERPDYPRLARERFGGLPRSANDVVFLGDSQVQNAPLADLVSQARQRGIGGQTVADLRAWVDQVLASPPRRLVLLAGTNNAIERQSADAFARDYADLLDHIAERAPRTDVVVLTIPPGTGEWGQRVPAMNRALRDLAARRDVQVVDLFAPLADDAGRLRRDLTYDGTHLNDEGYARVASAFRAASGT